jgi:hypothetical protein
VIRAAFGEGVRRVASAPALLLGVYLVTALLALPFALALRGSIDAHLGRSLVAGAVSDGVDYDWWQEFRAQAAGLGTTFTPSILGFAATLRNISGLADRTGPPAALAWALAAYLLVWTFLLGGILDRYARQRPTGAPAFFTASGVVFFRFLRLALVAAALYWILFAYVHDWLFDRWYEVATRDLADERVAFAWRVAMYAIFGALLVAVNVVLDYAKVRAVVEDRRSMLGALLASLRYVRRHARPVVRLSLLDAAVFLALIALWALIAPGAGGSGAGLWLRFLVGQLYVLARLAIKLQFLASETALFQASLAHARYTRVPVADWPPAPAVEMIAVQHVTNARSQDVPRRREDAEID